MLEVDEKLLFLREEIERHLLRPITKSLVRSFGENEIKLRLFFLSFSFFQRAFFSLLCCPCCLRWLCLACPCAGGGAGQRGQAAGRSQGGNSEADSYSEEMRTYAGELE